MCMYCHSNSTIASHILFKAQQTLTIVSNNNTSFSFCCNYSFDNTPVVLRMVNCWRTRPIIHTWILTFAIFLINSPLNSWHDSFMEGQSFTECFIFVLSGGRPMIAGSCKDHWLLTRTNVSFVAVAVSASTCTDCGIKLLTVPTHLS